MVLGKKLCLSCVAFSWRRHVKEEETCSQQFFDFFPKLVSIGGGSTIFRESIDSDVPEG